MHPTHNEAMNGNVGARPPYRNLGKTTACLECARRKERALLFASREGSKGGIVQLGIHLSKPRLARYDCGDSMAAAWVSQMM